MTKLALVVVSLAALLGTTQAYAQQSECKGEIAKAEGAMVSMTDEAQKQAVTKELNAAKDMMAKNNEKECMAHMQNVREQMLKARKGAEGG